MSSSTLLQYTETQRLDILKEYGKSPEEAMKDVECLKKWMLSTKGLQDVADARVIERFLGLNKYDLEKTKSKLEMYYRVRSIIPEFYNKNPNDPSFQKVMDMVYFIPLPKLTGDLNRVVIIKARDTNVDNFDPTVYVAHTLSVAEVRLREDYNLSEIHIYDLSGLQIGHFTKFTPGLVRKGSFVLEKVFSSRSKGLHYVNAPRFIGPFVSLLKMFLNRKLANKIFVHKDMDSLSKVVPKDILPKEYGGNERSLDELNDEWKKKFLEYDSLFQHLRELKIKEDTQLEQSLSEDSTKYEENFQQLKLE